IGGVVEERNSEYEIVNLDFEYRFDAFSARLLATRTQEDWTAVLEEREYVGVTNGCACDGVVSPTGGKVETDIIELRLVSRGEGRLDWIAGAYYEDVDDHAAQNV